MSDQSKGRGMRQPKPPAETLDHEGKPIELKPTDLLIAPDRWALLKRLYGN